MINPAPAAADLKRAKQLEEQFSYAKLREGLYAKLKAHDGRDSEGDDGMMAFAYAQFSSCVHGGPLGHEYLAAVPDAQAVAATAADLLVPWSSALIMILTKSRSHNDTATKAAVAVQQALVRWLGARFPAAVPGTTAGPARQS
jgi:hypothetical protein